MKEIMPPKEEGRVQHQSSYKSSFI